ncbi:MAG: HAD hydrolase family protein [Phycisphaerales bacterium JB063]
MRYRLIAIDLDGTLLCPQGQASAENLGALHDARAKGVHILPCTGRGWRESHRVISGLPDAELGIFNTGALVCNTADGSTVDAAPLSRKTVLGLIELLRGRPEAVLLYTDPAQTGLEYVATGDGRLTRNTRWWFEDNGLRFVETPTPDANVLDHIVRVGLVLPSRDAEEIVRLVTDRFAGKVEAHAFDAVQMDEDEPMHIVEIFGPGVTKWRGIEVVAQRFGIVDAEVAVIGDQVNDLPMFRRAGCAVAMGNAIPAIKAIAHRETRCNQTHGVAHAVEQMLAGAW